VVGKVSARRVVVVERGPVSVFAKAVKDRDPVFQDPRAARAAGFDGIPAPPTFGFALPYWGEFAEMQDGAGPIASNPMWEVMGKLGPGLILHGEQEFEYHRPVLVGDVLSGEDVITDVYERDTETHTMTFVVTETTWRDARSGELALTTRFNLVHRVRRAS
jgi:acyl dehydratase